MAKKSKTKKVRITQVRSGIGRQEGHRRTIRALGIKRHQQSVVQELTPAIQGGRPLKSHVDFSGLAHGRIA